MVVGEMIAFTVIVLTNARYIKKLEANNNIPVPEWGLPCNMLGEVLFNGGLFWFGWSGYSGNAHWIVPVLSGLFTGLGIFSIFLSLLNYLVDVYLMFAASAIAANIFMRSIFGGVFPLYATYMFDGMGIQWVSTLLGCVALLLVPMSVVFYIFGKRLRAKSNFVPALDIEQHRKRDEESRGSDEAVDTGSTTEGEYSRERDLHKEKSKEK
jgi:DHA1 family multidrug resistance protein-like MFS transporter